mmetsp:Transcript_13571/g.14987  ORF Transcript_13571/g.14987 Transcript_13571/m.14987 type:complete len:190 (+) Transcript_13571:24-593(+)
MKYTLKGYNKTKYTLTLAPAAKEFHFHLFEDEWDDWPYPHSMEYDIKGSFTQDNNVFNCTVTSVFYTTKIEDDLDLRTRTARYEVKELSEASLKGLTNILGDGTKVKITSTTVRNWIPFTYSKKFTANVLKGSLSFQLEPFTDEEKLQKMRIKFSRFPKLWSKTQDGLDMSHGLEMDTVELRKEGQSKI